MLADIGDLGINLEDLQLEALHGQSRRHGYGKPGKKHGYLVDGLTERGWKVVK